MQPDKLQSDPHQSERPLVSSRLARILIVDDDAAIRLATEGALRRSGHEVHQVPSGDEALALIAQRPHDFELVLLDLTMPGLSGREVLGVLRRDYPQISVIISSGNRFDPSEMEPRPDAILRKPFRVHDLIGVVEQVLTQRTGEPPLA